MVKLDAEFPRLTYAHRSWSDAEMYLFFNESNKEESRMASIAGHGTRKCGTWARARFAPCPGATAEGDYVRFPLLLEPYETKVVVVGRLPVKVEVVEGVRSRPGRRALLWRNWAETGRWN